MLTPEVISGTAGVALSLLLAYVPGLNAAWAKLSGDVKRAVLGVLLVLVAAGALAYHCQDAPNFAACAQGNWLEFAKALFIALVGASGSFVFVAEKQQAKLAGK